MKHNINMVMRSEGKFRLLYLLGVLAKAKKKLLIRLQELPDIVLSRQKKIISKGGVIKLIKKNGGVLREKIYKGGDKSSLQKIYL